LTSVHSRISWVEFSQAIMRGKILADAHVAEKLLSRTPA
jgi:hypothetical protein